MEWTHILQNFIIFINFIAIIYIIVKFLKCDICE